MADTLHFTWELEDSYVGPKSLQNLDVNAAAIEAAELYVRTYMCSPEIRLSSLTFVRGTEARRVGRGTHEHGSGSSLHFSRPTLRLFIRSRATCATRGESI